VVVPDQPLGIGVASSTAGDILIAISREQSSRKRLLDAGASSLPRAPWLHRSQLPSAVALVRFAVWRGQSDDVNDLEGMSGVL